MSSSVPSQRSFAEPVFCIRASTVMLLRFEGSKSRLRMRISETVYSNGRCIVRSRTVTRPFEISRSAIRASDSASRFPRRPDAVISAAGAGFAAVGAGTADVVISVAGQGGCFRSGIRCRRSGNGGRRSGFCRRGFHQSGEIVAFGRHFRTAPRVPKHRCGRIQSAFCPDRLRRVLPQRIDARHGPLLPVAQGRSPPAKPYPRS